MADLEKHRPTELKEPAAEVLLDGPNVQSMIVVAIPNETAEKVDNGDAVTPRQDPAEATLIDGDNSTHAPPLTLPSLPQYEILERIGEGGMGVVYAVRGKNRDSVEAIKRWVAPSTNPCR